MHLTYKPTSWATAVKNSNVYLKGLSQTSRFGRPTGRLPDILKSSLLVSKSRPESDRDKLDTNYSSQNIKLDDANYKRLITIGTYSHRHIVGI